MSECGHDPDRAHWVCLPRTCDRHTPDWKGSTCPEQLIFAPREKEES